MSFSEEKMYILKMLEEGKISSGEAARLLEALGSGSKSDDCDFLKKKDKKVTFNEEFTKVKDKLNDWKNEFKKIISKKILTKPLKSLQLKWRR